MSSPSVEVVVLNWNGRPHLERCLEALADQLDPGLEWLVTVVDNGSDDESVSWLERSYPEGPTRLGRGEKGRLRLRALEENLGFCGGNNAAAEASDADWVVLLNNDTAPEPEWLGHLVDAARSAPEDVAAVSGRLISWDRSRVDFVRGVMTFDGHAFQHGYRKPLEQWPGPASGSELPFACGGNMIVRRRSFVDAGLFDPAYFAYLEDVDLGWRLWSRGERVLYCAEATARHRSMATSDQLGQDRRGFLFERNAFLTAYKNYDEAHFGKMMPAVLFTFLARTRTLLADNNAGGAAIRRDPYCDGTPPAMEVPPQPTLWQKWRGWGTRELTRRGVRKARRRLATWLAPVEEAAPVLESVLVDDPRSLAQLQAASHLIDHLESASIRRRDVQSQRRRPDGEIFERFPLYVVPTYPGDESLFADPGFRALLPRDVPVQRATLADLMEMG